MVERAPGKRVLIIVEGVSDRDFVKAMLEKLPGIKAKILKMDGQDYSRAIKLINAYGSKVDLIVMLLDQHCSPEEKISEVKKNIEEGVSKELQGKLHVLTVRRAIEAWFLADPEALKSLCSKAGFNGNPEEEHDPAEILRRELRKCDKEYVKSRWGEKLGREIDLERAAGRSESLKTFLETLRDS